MTAPTHLDAQAAYDSARAGVLRLWPEWTGDLLPLKPLVKPLRATVFRITGAPVPAVVKVWGAGNGSKPAAQAARQSDVAREMGNGPHRASAVLRFDPDLCALVMQDVGTQSLGDILRDHPSRLEPLARQSGQWLARYHRPSLRPHPFRPAGLKTWLLRLAQDCRTGQRQPPDAAGFTAAALQHAETAMALRGRASAKAITHRDLTLGNLIQGPDALFGIDFENVKEDEPFRDLFSLALDLGRAGLPALSQGYGTQITDPDVTAFLCRAFALGLWANTPAAPSNRQAARLEMARTLYTLPWTGH